MKHLLNYSLLLILSLPLVAQNVEIYPAELQIKMATSILPEEQQAVAMVYGYDENGNFVKLRNGKEMVCLADDPDKEGIKIDCYSHRLEDFMARGRELRREGLAETKVREIRKKEADAGILDMPDVPSMLYVYTGKEKKLNKSTGEVSDGNFRYVIYTPYATTESTGLPAMPMVPGMPWLMDPGTHRAHIMISPPQ